MQKSQPSNPSSTAKPNDQYTMMASRKQQQPPPPSQQQPKDTDRIDVNQKLYSGDYNTIRQVTKNKEMMGKDNCEARFHYAHTSNSMATSLNDVFMPKDNTVVPEDGEIN